MAKPLEVAAGAITGLSTKAAMPDVVPVPGCSTGGTPSMRGCNTWAVCGPAAKPGGSGRVMRFGAIDAGVCGVPPISTWVTPCSGAVNSRPFRAMSPPAMIGPLAFGEAVTWAITGWRMVWTASFIDTTGSAGGGVGSSASISTTLAT